MANNRIKVFVPYFELAEIRDKRGSQHAVIFNGA